MLEAIDPRASSLRQALWFLPPSGRAPLPISIQTADTLSALCIFGSAAVLFWICKRICTAGGLGRIVRAVAIIGIGASLAAIVQRGESKELLYGIWRPIDAGARPFGPFVSRNHFATWAIMAAPLVFGYLLARAPERREGATVSQRIVDAAQQLGSMRIWLAISVCLLTVAVLISTSRSGLIGLMVAGAACALLSRLQRQSTTRGWMVFQAALLFGAVLAFSNFDALLARVDETLTPAARSRGRAAIWADTRTLIKDFAATGTGAGTYGTAISAYQTSEEGYAIGQAHNHYLQVAAEGGLLVAVPAALTLAAFLWSARERLAADASGDFFVRAGAVAGLTGVLMQSVWETGLRMPANAMLCAVLAAIATHAAPQRGGRPDGREC
jgi:O-antigen ligase